MWTSAPFPRQKLHMGAWNPTIFTFWHIITRKDIAMEPLRQERSTLPGHLGFFLMGGKFLSSPNVLWDCTEGRKEGKWRMPCLAMKLLQGITQIKSLYPWRKWRCFCTASLNPTHLDEPLAAVTLDRAVPLSLFLIFPLSRSALRFAIIPCPRHITPPHTYFIFTSCFSVFENSWLLLRKLRFLYIP